MSNQSTFRLVNTPNERPTFMALARQTDYGPLSGGRSGNLRARICAPFTKERRENRAEEDYYGREGIRRVRFACVQGSGFIIMSVSQPAAIWVGPPARFGVFSFMGLEVD